jgi:hypothetical protein
MDRIPNEVILDFLLYELAIRTEQVLVQEHFRSCEKKNNIDIGFSEACSDGCDAFDMIP